MKQTFKKMKPEILISKPKMAQVTALHYQWRLLSETMYCHQFKITFLVIMLP